MGECQLTDKQYSNLSPGRDLEEAKSFPYDIPHSMGWILKEEHCEELTEDCYLSDDANCYTFEESQGLDTIAVCRPPIRVAAGFGYWFTPNGGSWKVVFTGEYQNEDYILAAIENHNGTHYDSDSIVVSAKTAAGMEQLTEGGNQFITSMLNYFIQEATGTDPDFSPDDVVTKMKPAQLHSASGLDHGSQKFESNMSTGPRFSFSLVENWEDIEKSGCETKDTKVIRETPSYKFGEWLGVIY